MADENATRPITQKQKQEKRIVEKVFSLIDSQLKKNAEPTAGLRPEELTKFMRFMESARTIAASALLAAMCGAIYEYLALAGITDMSPARVILICAWFFGTLLVWEVASIFNVKARAWTIVVGAMLFAGVFYGLDYWAVRWRLHNPPDAAQLLNEFHDFKASVTQITEKTSSLRVTKDLNIKELLPVPGYLKLDFRYARRPVDQVGFPVTVDVFFLNKGSTYAHDSTFKANLFYADFHGSRPPVEHDPQMDKTFKDKIAAMPSAGTQDVAPGEALWASFDTSVLTETMFNDLQAGTVRIYFAARSDWKSNGVADSATVCVWLQPSTWTKRPGVSIDLKKEEPIWHQC